MWLTELKNEIDKALTRCDDFEVKLIVNEQQIGVDSCGIDPGRFVFNIMADNKIYNCDEYHIEEDDSLELCSICGVYHSNEDVCPKCELISFKKVINALWKKGTS